MGKNQNTLSHRTKIIFHPLGSLAGFPSRFIILDRKTSEALGTHHLQATVTMDVIIKCLRQRSSGIYLSAVFYMYVFSWFHSV